MKRKLQWLTVTALLAGALFAWTTIVLDYRRFLGSGATFFQFEGCAFPNPLTTPCFYGAIVFVIALLMAARILKVGDDAPPTVERNLTRLLVAGTVFAWGNFGWELWKYYRPHTGPFLSCSGTLALHPVFTPCFVGAMIYLFALLAAWNAARTHWETVASPAE